MQGVELELPPIILGRYGSDPSKKTVLVYGHYDVYFTFYGPLTTQTTCIEG
jgi:hypothetical protein